MAIIISVYIENASFINVRATPEVGKMDTYSAWEELNYSLPFFPPQYFVKPTFEVGISADDKYSWKVIIPNAEQKAFMQIKKFPAVFFFDVSQNKYLGRIDGRPKYQGEVYDYLKGLGLTPVRTPSVQASGLKKGLGIGLAGLFMLGFLKKDDKNAKRTKKVLKKPIKKQRRRRN